MPYGWGGVVGRTLPTLPLKMDLVCETETERARGREGERETAHMTMRQEMLFAAINFHN